MAASSLITVRRALLSVSDKSGLLELASALIELKIELIATEGTGQVLRASGLPVRDISEFTGFPEIMSGRIKTLHPKIHGALLARSDIDAELMIEHGISAIDLLVVNLYPFAETIANSSVSMSDAIEMIDIGGPAMLRAGAKNHQRVCVVNDPADYDGVLASLRTGGTALSQRRLLAAKVYAHTARYDGMVGEWLSKRIKETEVAELWPQTLHPSFNHARDLRYGENPHQRAALYIEQNPVGGIAATATVMQGKPLSYNNIADADAALECVKLFPDSAACVIVKHANPCGVAMGVDLLSAYKQAYACDPVSAFGGILAFNQRLNHLTAKAIIEHGFVEVVIAPEIDADALAVFSMKPNIRVLACGSLSSSLTTNTLDFKQVTGGLLVQDRDSDWVTPSNMRIVSKQAPSAAEFRDLSFAWRIAMMVKSNAIVYAREQCSLGIGAGQASRVISARIAAMKAEEAGLSLAGSVMASDAFFPFRDAIDVAAQAGVCAVIQPGGSIRDEEVIAAANEHSMKMVFTGIRHFRH